MKINCAPRISEELKIKIAEFKKEHPDRYPEGEVGDDSYPCARTLDEFVRPMGNDPDELLKHRFLCKRGGLLLVGATGHGKSSLAMQLMIKWALGQPVFGLEPARPLKSLLLSPA